MGSSTGNSPESSSFYCFPKLPLEIRNKIWSHAVEDATAARIILVTVHHRLQVVLHSCVTITGQFCHQHGRCDEYRPGRPNWTSFCMTAGYFSVSKDYPQPEDEISRLGLERLSLTCHESRAVVLEQYHEKMTIYRSRWKSAGNERCRIRCNPARDVLVITKVPDYSSAHAGAEPPQSNLDALDKAFPPDPELFSEFRSLISSFQNIACTYFGLRGKSNKQSSHMPPDFKIFLFFAESMRHLYMWPDPQDWPELDEGKSIRISNVKSLSTKGDRAVRYLQGDADDVLTSYNEYAKVQRDHCAESSDHWVPNPKDLEEIGSFAARSWVP
ncbi:hypothetical protein BX600DRAFT_468604 [Xylariales sp. PMI_506]|nr:hypothetical protein BX600DRAFT_468604 [Xylariales sp. PMI_506]